MKNFYIILFIVLSFFIVFFVQKINYDKKIRIINDELIRIKDENIKLQEKINFVNEFNTILLDKNNLIDREEKECLYIAKTTADSLNCTDIATKKWNEEITNYLNLIKQSLSSEEYNLFDDNQNFWIVLNKSNDDIITTYVYNHGGTMYYQEAANYYLQEKKQRAEFLKSIYDILSNK